MEIKKGEEEGAINDQVYTHTYLVCCQEKVCLFVHDGCQLFTYQWYALVSRAFVICVWAELRMVTIALISWTLGLFSQ